MHTPWNITQPQKRVKSLPFAAVRRWTWRVLRQVKYVRHRKTNSLSSNLYVESKKFKKLVNTTKKKKTHRYREHTVVTSGKREGGKGDIRTGKWELHIIGSRVYWTT